MIEPTHPVLFRLTLSVLLSAPFAVMLITLWGLEWERASTVVDGYFRWFVAAPIGGWILWKAVTS